MQSLLSQLPMLPSFLHCPPEGICCSVRGAQRGMIRRESYSLGSHGKANEGDGSEEGETHFDR